MSGPNELGQAGPDYARGAGFKLQWSPRGRRKRAHDEAEIPSTFYSHTNRA